MLYYQSYSRTEHQPCPEKNYNTWPHRHSRSNTDNDIKKIFQQLQTIQPTQTKPLSAAIKPQRQHCRIKQQFCLLFIAYIFGYLSFLVAGGFIFSWLETRSHLTNQRPSLLDIKTNFLAKHSSVSDKVLEDFITEILNVNGREINEFNDSASEQIWSLQEAVFFASTIVTTIGYGHMAPISQSGKVFCIVYAIIGIPLTLVLLQAFVNRLLPISKHLLQSMLSHLCPYYCSHLQIRLIHLFLVTFLNVIILYLMPAAIFTKTEPQWTFLDSLYYCFISLTTIGLGDYVPVDTATKPINKIILIVYLYVGIICLMLNLSIFNEIPELNIGRFLSATNSTPQSNIPNPNPNIATEFKLVDKLNYCLKDCSKRRRTLSSNMLTIFHI